MSTPFSLSQKGKVLTNLMSTFAASKASLGFFPPTLVLQHNSECYRTMAKKWALAQRLEKRILMKKAKGWPTEWAELVKGSSISADPHPWAPSWCPFPRSQRPRVCPVSHS